MMGDQRGKGLMDCLQIAYDSRDPRRGPVSAGASGSVADYHETKRRREGLKVDTRDGCP